MKMKIMFPVLLSALLIFGCSRGMSGGLVSNSSAAQLERGRAIGAAYYETTSAQSASVSFDDISDTYDRLLEEEAASEAANLNNTERKLVKRANIRIRVESFESADASISALMEKYNAYAASTEVEENSRYYSLRVPAHVYDTFLAEMNGMGRLLHLSESTEDVTLRYYDLEGRLATKRELLKTFQDYLGKARNIDEILSVEARISELQYDIDSTGIQLRNLANRVDYATIDLNLLGPVTSTPYRSATLGERVKELFGNFGGFLSTTAVILIGFVIYGLPILLLLLLLFWLLFGRIGLVKKLWQTVRGKKQE